jgi:phosphohistidine phosphatase SixA
MEAIQIKMMKHFLKRIILPAFLLCQLAAAQNPHTIFLVRHAEKATAPADDPALTPAGEKRAACLAKMLEDAGIKQIFVTDTKRTQQTAAPLAAALKLTPAIIPAKDPNSLISKLTYAGAGNILVVGHSNTLPFVLARMKAGTVREIAENEYDRMFVVTMAEGTTAALATLRYCECGTTAPGAKPAASPKPATKKTPAKKP